MCAGLFFGSEKNLLKKGGINENEKSIFFEASDKDK